MLDKIRNKFISSLIFVVVLIATIVVALLWQSFHGATLPLGQDNQGLNAGYLSNLYVLGAAILALLFVLAWALWQLKGSLRAFQLKNAELQMYNAFFEEKISLVEALNKQLTTEQNKLESVFSSVSDTIILIDGKGIIQSVNHSVLNLLGYWQDELIGKDIGVLMPESIASRHGGFLEKYLTQSMPLGLAIPERRFIAKDKTGNLIDVDLEVRTIPVEDQIWFVGVLRDIRAQVELENTLKAARDEAINTANLKSQFLANMSHELRTPLNGMISMSQLLEEDLKTPVMKDRAKVISTSAKHLLSIVNDILDFSRIQSGKFELYPKPFDVETWLIDTLAIHLQVAKDKELTLSLEIQEGVPKALLGDTLRLSQILHNLLSNALKFTTEGGVSIHLSLLKSYVQEDVSMAELVLAVKDSGMGMSENALKELFQPFSQVDNSASRVHGGTGLGLMISCELTRMMHGDIQVSSTLGEGSVFRVRVLLAVSDETRMERVYRDIALLDKFAQHSPVLHHVEESLGDEALHQPEVFHTYRLLVVEDNPVNQKVVSALLKRFGYEFDTANHGEDALEKLSLSSYDLILMDCQMPILDGYETTRKLRHRELSLGTHIPVIALTAHAMEGEDQKCYAAGMDDYITKPLDHAILKEKIARWLKK